jgi:hypothetical protein
MSNRRTLEEQIEAAKKEAEQKQKRLKELVQRQNAAERKARNHRLCKRGGKVEGLLPALAILDDEQFDLFVEMCLNTAHTRKVLAELAPPEPAADPNGGDADKPPAEAATQGGGNAAPKPTEAVTQGNVAPTPKAAGTAQNNGANGNHKPAQQNGGGNHNTSTQAANHHGGNANGKPAEASRATG